jgi:(E)-4-hydroxy-3-methylbut-2-enyl-diphosphate synthase
LRKRRITKNIKVGNTGIGSDYPVSMQSMTNVPVEDVPGSISQINELAENGAEFVRLAVRNESSVEYLKEIIESVEVPLIADIHFNYKIAVKSIEAGIKKIRLNPGNIPNPAHVKEVIKAAADYSVPIRIGVNGGSINRKKYSHVNPESLVDSALEHIKILEDNNFNDIVVSIKTSDIYQTIESNIMFAEQREYPIHIGLTEAGYGIHCTVQSSLVIGHLLMQGIGDTIRVSMTGNPVNELEVARNILETTGDREATIRMISCPTCGRTDSQIDILEISRCVEKECRERFGEKLAEEKRTLKIAVMGCEVNGPGEAAEADVGIAGGREGNMLLFAGGEKIRMVKSEDAVEMLLREVEKLI